MLLAMQTNAQNLVQNGDFESVITPAPYPCRIIDNSVVGWTSRNHCTDTVQELNGGGTYNILLKNLAKLSRQDNIPAVPNGQSECQSCYVRYATPDRPSSVNQYYLCDNTPNIADKNYLLMEKWFTQSPGTGSPTPGLQNNEAYVLGTLTKVLDQGCYEVGVATSLPSNYNPLVGVCGTVYGDNKLRIYLVEPNIPICPPAGGKLIFTSDCIDTYGWQNEFRTFDITAADANKYANIVLWLEDRTGSKNHSAAIDDISIKKVAEIYAGADKVICSGEQVTLNTTFYPASTIGQTYQWSAIPNTNSIITRLDANSITVNPITTTDYIITVTFPNGCIDRDTVRVNVLSAPTPTIVGSITMCEPINSVYSAQLDGTPSSTTQYFWSVTGGTATPNNTPQTNISWNGSGGGTITLQLTDTDPTTGKVCSSSATLDVYACCMPKIGGGSINGYIQPTDYIEYINNKTASDYFGSNTRITNVDVHNQERVFVINGVFEIDQDMTFEKVRFSMGPYAKIVITQPSTLLTLNSCRFHYCDETKPWDGIKSITYLSVVEARDCVFEYAAACLESSNSGRIAVSDSKFNHNIIDIKINASSQIFSPLALSGNTFGSQSFQLPKIANITADNVKNLTIGDVRNPSNNFKLKSSVSIPLEIMPAIRLRNCFAQIANNKFIQNTPLNSGEILQEFTGINNNGIIPNIHRSKPVNAAIWVYNYQPPSNL
jgi:hypothetical protein